MGTPERPTNPDLWGKDPFYDVNDRSQRALWAIILCVTLALLIVGGIGFLWGTGVAADDGSTPTPVTTITETETVTAKPTARAKASAKTITKVGPTVYRTRPAQVIRVTSAPKVITVTKTPRPLPRVTKTIEVEIEVPGPTVTETIEAEAGLSDGF
jgi:hypothetical protein